MIASKRNEKLVDQIGRKREGKLNERSRVPFGVECNNVKDGDRRCRKKEEKEIEIKKTETISRKGTPGIVFRQLAEPAETLDYLQPHDGT